MIQFKKTFWSLDLRKYSIIIHTFIIVEIFILSDENLLKWFNRQKKQLILEKIIQEKYDCCYDVFMKTLL